MYYYVNYKITDKEQIAIVTFRTKTHQHYIYFLVWFCYLHVIIKYSLYGFFKKKSFNEVLYPYTLIHYLKFINLTAQFF